MEKDMIFFSSDDKGLTSTSANHIANLAKEMIRDIEEDLENIMLYSTELTLIGKETSKLLNTGAGDEDVKLISDKLHKTAAAKSLIAWLREAIKAKERMLSEVENTTLTDFAKKEGIELEDRPMMQPFLSEDEYFASKSVDERCRYYELETLASALGKAIHPGGTFADARKDLQNKTKKPNIVSGSGRDALVYTYSPTASNDVVEAVYFNLQKQYREAQARLNAMKHDCQNAIKESEIASKTEFTKSLTDWTNRRQVIEARLAEYIQKKTKKISRLKIIIPESLKDIYESVNALGKQKA